MLRFVAPSPSRAVRASLGVMILLLAVATAAPAATLQITGPPGASVRLGDQDLGRLPLAGPLQLEPGVYEIHSRARGYRDLTETVTLAEPGSWAHLRLQPVQLRRGHAVGASLVYAGLGQWYSGARVRGWVYFLGESGGLLTALAGELQRKNHRDDYLNSKALYDAALTPDEIARWRAQTDRSYRDMKDMESLRNTGLYVAAGAYVLSLLDAWLLFPGADIGPGLVPPSSPTVATGDHLEHGRGIHARVTIAF